MYYDFYKKEKRIELFWTLLIIRDVLWATRDVTVHPSRLKIDKNIWLFKSVEMLNESPYNWTIGKPLPSNADEPMAVDY